MAEFTVRDLSPQALEDLRICARARHSDVNALVVGLLEEEARRIRSLRHFLEGRQPIELRHPVDVDRILARPECPDGESV